jgi:hypothetical protein
MLKSKRIDASDMHFLRNVNAGINLRMNYETFLKVDMNIPYILLYQEGRVGRK